MRIKLDEDYYLWLSSSAGNSPDIASHSRRIIPYLLRIGIISGQCFSSPRARTRLTGLRPIGPGMEKGIYSVRSVQSVGIQIITPGTGSSGN